MGNDRPAQKNHTTAGWGATDKFTVVLETAGLNATELSAYCRERGLYPEQVERWRQASQDANEKPVLTLKEQKELERLRAQDQKEIKRLKQELWRKEKALGLPQLGGQVSGPYRFEFTGADELLFVIDRAEIANR